MASYASLSQEIRVDVLGVEYNGYGAASGQPSPKSVMQAADAAYDYAIKSGVPASRILLYGQSIGSGPAAGLAKRRAVAGVILHSPLLSGIQVLDPSPECCCKPSCVYACCDFFRNDRAVRSVRCPVFIMHGQDDTIVPFYHGVRLRDLLPEYCAWPGYFPEGACHNDIIDVDVETYYAKVRAFVKSIKEGQAVTIGKEIEGEMATSEGQLPESRPAQVAMVSLRSGGAARDLHMQVQTPAQQTMQVQTPGNNVAGRTNSRSRKHSPEAIAARRKSPGRSMSPIAAAMATMNRASPPGSPFSSPRFPRSPRPSRTVNATPSGLGVSRMVEAEADLTISLTAEASGGNSSGRGFALPRPVLPSFGFWEPEVGRLSSISPRRLIRDSQAGRISSTSPRRLQAGPEARRSSRSPAPSARRSSRSPAPSRHARTEGYVTF